jgi:hypothetical protein
MKQRVALRHGLWIFTLTVVTGCVLPSLTPEPSPPDASLVEADAAVDHMLVDLSILQAGGTEALRAEARRLAISGKADEHLRRALVLLALGDGRDEDESMRLLETHLERRQREPADHRGDAWLAQFLLNQIEARRRIKAELAAVTGQRDRLRRQLEELVAIEEAIRERSQGREIELEP